VHICGWPATLVGGYRSGAMATERIPALILVVEDDRDLRDLLVMMLSDEGYRVVTAADGLDGLKVARGDSPDLILVDAGMPRLDGAGFCRAYRAEGGPAPVILVSAGHAEQIATTVEACGAVAYIAKPFEVDLVLDTVTRHLPAADC
jgi:two-component system, chemotaxis family, chemotaxis protein CheY